MRNILVILAILAAYFFIAIYTNGFAEKRRANQVEDFVNHSEIK